MEPHDDPKRRTDAPSTDDIDDKYSDVDPDDVAEDAIDYFSGDPTLESERGGE